MVGHFIEYLLAFLEQAFAAKYADNDSVNVLVRFAPDLALHILKESKRPLPIAALRELLENESEVVERELILEDVKASSDAAPRREATELVNQSFNVVAVLSFLHYDGGVTEDEFFRLRSYPSGTSDCSPIAV